MIRDRSHEIQFDDDWGEAEKDDGSESSLNDLLNAEWLAEKFHTLYEKYAVELGYETRKDSSVPWKDVPELNKKLMIRVCKDILECI